VTVDDLLVRRDIYYTPDIQGISASRVGDYHLGKKEFFVLGDNSPVSLDSRQDTDEAIVRRADVLGRVWRWR
ncbi:MAG: S26 family signal peptidase, partial [Planctomycetales bacterium]